MTMMIFYGVRDYFSLLERFFKNLIPLRRRFSLCAAFLDSFVSHLHEKLSHNGSFLCIEHNLRFFSLLIKLRIFNFMGSDFFLSPLVHA